MATVTLGPLLGVLAFRVAAPATALVLFGLGSELVAIHNQSPIQRGIDAHPVRVEGTYAGLHEAEWKYGDDLYVVDYEYEARPIRAELRLLPGRPSAGDSVCMEIDARQPDHARPCGTRGDLDDAKNGLVIGTVALGALLLFCLAAWVAHLRRDTFGPKPVARGIAVPTAKKLRDRPVTMHPAVATRIAMTVIYSSASALTVLATWTEAAVPRFVPVLLAVGTAVLVVRCLQAGIRCADGVVTVRGLLVTRRIPLTAVLDVTNGATSDGATAYPVIHWRRHSHSGATSYTRLFYFGTADISLETVDRHNDLQLATLRRWIRVNRGGEDVARVRDTS
jgi:hypothetical protein